MNLRKVNRRLYAYIRSGILESEKIFSIASCARDLDRLYIVYVRLYAIKDVQVTKDLKEWLNSTLDKMKKRIEEVESKQESTNSKQSCL